MSYIPTYDCTRLSSFYNYNNYTDYLIRGRLFDGTTNLPIEGGLIAGWDDFWNGSSIRMTFTKYDGTFELYADINLNNLIVTAPEMDVRYQAATEPIKIRNRIINIGESETYSTNNKIYVENVTVSGNNTSGGNLYLNTPSIITFGSGTTVEKGGILITTQTNHNVIDVGDIYIYPIDCLQNKSQSVLSNYSDNIQSYMPDINHLSIFPNPSDGLYNVASSTRIDNIFVYKLNGQLIYSNDNLSRKDLLDLREHPSGMFCVVVYSGNSVFRKIIIKE